jgi:ATP-dependent Clp protease adaptor protein ClpS
VAFDLDSELEIDFDISEPKKYKVILLNDDYSTMDFVIEVLMEIFNKSFEDAKNLMLAVHKKGRAICGIYSHEIAEMKVYSVKTKARDSGFPLKAVMEEVDNG